LAEVPQPNCAPNSAWFLNRPVAHKVAPGTRYTVRVALIVALGGFLMGFDASVISGVVGFIEPEFGLSKIQLGWSVASLTLTATIAMMLAGPISDRLARRPVLKIAAALFAVSAIASAVAPDFISLVVARMLGGFGVGAALIIAPMYIAEIAPPDLRGRMVSFNQLNIVIGISAAYFSNFLILSLGQSDLGWVQTLGMDHWAWRWMLGVEALPAIFYFLALFFVPESPRWLIMHHRDEEAMDVMTQVSGRAEAEAELADVHASMSAAAGSDQATLRELFQPAMKLVLTIGISIAILQQITGINSVFFYAPMIFEQSGIGTDASFMQAVLVGLLLGAGLVVIAGCMLLLAWGFGSATYTITPALLDSLPALDALRPLVGQTFGSDVAFREAVVAAVGADVFAANQSALVGAAIDMNPTLILIGILGFVAGFAISLGPVMWVLFSELFPNRVRGLAISFVGLINSSVSFLVQLVFPWELSRLGNSLTFLIYGLFAIVGLVVVMRLLPETKGRSLEELEAELVR
jgi:MFS family permease